MSGTGSIDYRSLRHSAGWVGCARDVLWVNGADAEAFLQGQCSQDVAALAPGEVAPSLLLRPDGRLCCLMRIHRLGPDRFACDMAAGLGATALSRLERFRLAVKLDMALRQAPMLMVRGPAAPPPPNPGADAAAETLVAAVNWAGLPGWDLIGADTGLEGAAPCRPEALEAVRIEAGVPAAPGELYEGLIPAEAAVVSETVSFTKGCYVGQELVARIDSRGNNTPRRLRGLVTNGDPPPAGATLLTDGGDAVGAVTSSAYSPGLGASVALAYVKRRVEPPARLTLSDGRSAEVRSLPLVP